MNVRRRQLLTGLAAMAAGAATASATTPTALAATGLARATPRESGSLPYPHLAPGTDTIPQVEHIVVLMMENHSFDNKLGMLRRPGLDGFTLGANANDMLDMLDLTSPAFSTPPPLARPLPDTDSSALACNSSGPGTIPPPGSVVPLG